MSSEGWDTNHDVWVTGLVLHPNFVILHQSGWLSIRPDGAGTRQV